MMNTVEELERFEKLQETAIENLENAPTQQTANRPLIYVCSPLAGEIEENIRKAREFSKFAAEQGFTPIAPHITELFNDEIPEEREMGLSMGVEYLKKADAIWVFGNRISDGMANEIRIAKEELNIPIYHVEAPPFEVKPYDVFLQSQVQATTPITNKEDIAVGRNFTQDQLARAKTVNLLNYVDSHGYQTKKHGNAVKLIEGEHDSTLIFPETNTWCDMSTGVGGDTVSFLTKHEGKNMVSAVHELIGETFNPQNLFIKEAQQKREHAPVILPPKADDNKRAYAYLIKTRGLDRDIVDENIKKGNIYQSKEIIKKGDKTLTFNNCIFVGKDQDDKPQYASQRSMNDDSGYNFKADVANSKKEYGFLLKGDNVAEWLTVCESPIDALSIASLQKMRGEYSRDEHILSLGGVSDKAIDKFLETTPNIKVINIALDNDEAGRNAGERIKEKYTELGFDVVESYPKLKDYNLELKRAIVDNQKPTIDAPPRAVNNNRAFMFLTTIKNIDAELANTKIDNSEIYQSDKLVRTNSGEEKTVSNTVFAHHDAQGSVDYAISVGYNTSTEKADFKIEYYNDQNEHNYLSATGSNDELLVFNNPISMLTHQNYLALSGQPNANNYLCAVSNIEKSVSTFLEANPNIKNVRVMLDKSSFIDQKSNQLIDTREVAFSRIKQAVGSKIVSVTKKYPKGVDLNKDFQSAKTNSKSNDNGKGKGNEKHKTNSKNNNEVNRKFVANEEQGYENER